MLNKVASFVVVSAYLCAATLSFTANASLITMSSDEIINVSLDGDNNSVGTVKSDGLTGSDIIARERLNQSQQDKRIASFIQFDLSALTTDIVNASYFSATFSADFVARLNTINNMSVMLGQVTSDWQNAAGMLPTFELADVSINQTTLVDNVKTDAFGSYSVDLTTVVRDWVNGGSTNYGLVVFGEKPVYQGAGFDNVALQVEVPEPSTIAVFALGIMGLVLRRSANK